MSQIINHTGWKETLIYKEAILVNKPLSNLPQNFRDDFFGFKLLKRKFDDILALKYQCFPIS